MYTVRCHSCNTEYVFGKTGHPHVCDETRVRHNLSEKEYKEIRAQLDRIEKRVGLMGLF